MTVPALHVTSDLSVVETADAMLLVLPADASEEELRPYASLIEVLKGIAYTARPDAFTRVFLPTFSEKPVAVVGYGTQRTAGAIRNAVGSGIRQFTGFDHIGVAVIGANETDAAAEGALLGAYSFDAYKSGDAKPRASTITILGDCDIERAHVIAEAVALTKDLTNTPAEWLSPEQLAQIASGLAVTENVSAQIWDEKQLEAEGFGGILGVGKGSDRPPRLVKLEYSPKNAKRHIALVGKGITFDTGGLSLKPAAAMLGMKVDMAGAATVAAALQAAAKLRSPNRITAWLCIADNMPSGIATRPGDVLRMYGGLSVEVTNTDAEGRLVLGDGLAKASEEKPDLLIDVATLTGAILVALGTRHTGVFGDDDAVAEYLSAAERTDEPAWHMPMLEHIESDLDSTIADLLNANMGSRFGSSSYAALFLRRFVGTVSDAEDAAKIPWVHLDIAGASVNDGSPYGYTGKGATGASVRALIELLTTSSS